MTIVDQIAVGTRQRCEKHAQNETHSPGLYSSEEIEGLHSADGLRVSEAEYWQTYYHDPDFRYEWNNGILEEKPMADYLGLRCIAGSFRYSKNF